MTDEFVPEISHIACMDEYELIGIDGNLPWNIPEELEYFKKVTKNSIIIMGNTTYKSLNREFLPERVNLVLSGSSEESDSDNLYFRKTLSSLLELANILALKDQVNIFIIGGSSLYNQTFDIISKIYLTVIKSGKAYSNKKDSEGNLLPTSFYDFMYKEDSCKLLSTDKLEVSNFEFPVYTFVFKVSPNESS